MRTRIKFVIVIIFLTIAVLFILPLFLKYADHPVKSEAIILIVGTKDRIQGINQLIDESYACYIIVPAHRKYFKVPEAGCPPLTKKFSIITPIPTSYDTVPYPYFIKRGICLLPLDIKEDAPTIERRHEFKYSENTHKEIILAKEMMDTLGLKSAILVSSPYHMRRIKMIATDVFKTGLLASKQVEESKYQYSLSFVPTRSQKTKTSILESMIENISNITTEYIKIIWFIIYSKYHQLEEANAA